MNKDLIFEIQLQKTNLHMQLEKFIKTYKLNEQAKNELNYIVNTSVNNIIHRIDNSEPYGSITKFEN